MLQTVTEAKKNTKQQQEVGATASSCIEITSIHVTSPHMTVALVTPIHIEKQTWSTVLKR